MDAVGAFHEDVVACDRVDSKILRELGSESEQEHKTILKLLKELGFKAVYLVGPEFSKLSDSSKFSTFNNVEELAQYLGVHPIAGYDIFVKGSNSIHLNKIIDSL